MNSANADVFTSNVATRSMPDSLNHITPPGPNRMSAGCEFAVGVVNSPLSEAVDTWMTATRAALSSVTTITVPNEAIEFGWELAVGRGVSVTAPPGVIRATLLPRTSVNHMLLSEPNAIPMGREFAVGIGNSVKARVFGLNMPIWLAANSVNQKFPAGSIVMSRGWLLAVG